jgi:hypothetical protein
MREDFSTLDESQFRVNACVELPIRGQLANREKPAKRVVRLETCDGGNHVVVDADIWERLKDIGGHCGLDLSSHAGMDFAKRLERFVLEAVKVIGLGRLGLGLRAYRHNKFEG